MWCCTIFGLAERYVPISLFSLGIIPLDGKAIKVLYLFSYVSFFELFVLLYGIIVCLYQLKRFLFGKFVVLGLNDYCLCCGTICLIEVPLFM